MQKKHTQNPATIHVKYRLLVILSAQNEVGGDQQSSRMQVLIETYRSKVKMYFFRFKGFFVDLAGDPVDAKVDYKVYNDKPRYIVYEELPGNSQSEPQHHTVHEHMQR